MVRLSLILIARSGQDKWLASALRTLRRQTRNTLGCLRCHVSADIDDPNTFYYVEEWKAEFDFRQEIGSERFRRLIDVIEAAAARPQVSVQFVGWSAGLDYMERALCKGD